MKDAKLGRQEATKAAKEFVVKHPRAKIVWWGTDETPDEVTAVVGYDSPDDSVFYALAQDAFGRGWHVAGGTDGEVLATGSEFRSSYARK